MADWAPRVYGQTESPLSYLVLQATESVYEPILKKLREKIRKYLGEGVKLPPYLRIWTSARAV